MKVFDKNAALRKLENKHNNNKLKRNTIIVSVSILFLAILYFSFARFESKVTFSLVNGTVSRQYNIVSYIKGIASTSSDLEYDGVGTLGDNGTQDNNLRYVGANPNNYMYYNCITADINEMSQSTCELWRIVGVFNNVEDSFGIKKSRVKIMRDSDAGEHSWDTNATDNDRNGINQWGESTYEDGTPYDGADLMLDLNGEYLGTPNMDFSINQYKKILPKYTSTGLSSPPLSEYSILDEYVAFIQDVKWYTGATPQVNEGFYENNELDFSKTKAFYESERSNNTGKVCTSGTDCTDTVVRTTMWEGKVALPYTSDGGYSTSGGTTNDKTSCLNIPMYKWDDYSDCINNSWIMKKDYAMWTLDALAYFDSGSTALSMGNEGIYDYSASWSYSTVHPTLFLIDDLEIVTGDGSQESPYIIGLTGNNR